MKKAVTAIVGILFVGLLGWSVFEFLSTDKNSTVEEDGGAMITAYPEDDSNEDVEASDEVGLDKGKIAPDFTTETLDGEEVQLSDYRGENVIVNFWATWCPPCRDEIPDFQKLYNEKDVDILAINLDETSDLDKVKEFVYEDFEMTFPVLLDNDMEIAERYRIAAYPTSYMVDADGRIQFVAMGPMNYDLMETELKKME